MAHPRYQSSSFDGDRLWGTIFVVLYALMLFVALLFVLGVGGAIALGGFSSHSPFPAFLGGAFATVAGIFVTAALGVHILGAVGIRQSRAWGFWLTIVLSILSLMGSAGFTCLTVVPLIYSIVRLAGVYGPKPV